jgi:hypothetical protein
MNNQNDHPSTQKHLEANNVDLRHIEYPRENNDQKTPIKSDQETNEINYSELCLSTSSPLSCDNNSRSNDINRQYLSLLGKFSDTSLSSPFSSGNEKSTPEKRSIYIPEQDRSDLTLECINEDVNYETKVTTFA